MSGTSTVLHSQEAKDRAATLRNRARLAGNKNLVFWYRQLYKEQFKDFSNPAALAILEIGSGTSPLKQFFPNVLTSDVLNLDYLDLVFDCHDIDKLDAINDNSLDVITLTNVLHHLQRPVEFLNRAASKLKSHGKIIATEPFFSVISTFIFKHLHHEPVDLNPSQPELNDVQGPLTSANIALPWLLFFEKRQWLQRLNENFDIERLVIRPFSALSYMATGGISRKLPVPHLLYRMLFGVDLALSRRFPKFCASFFILVLSRR
jgi:SAM-dependent methyltransferase